MSSSITVEPHLALERILSLEIVRVTERAAVSAARLRGHGKDKASDQAAVDAMRARTDKNLPIDGTVVIGEGELDEAPMLFIGEKVGTKNGSAGRYCRRSARGTVLCARHAGAIATMAMAEGGTLLNAPDVAYMEKIAIVPGYPKGVVDLDAPSEQNIRNLAKAKGVKPQ